MGWCCSALSVASVGTVAIGRTLNVVLGAVARCASTLRRAAQPPTRIAGLTTDRRRRPARQHLKTSFLSPRLPSRGLEYLRLPSYDTIPSADRIGSAAGWVYWSRSSGTGRPQSSNITYLYDGEADQDLADRRPGEDQEPAARSAGESVRERAARAVVRGGEGKAELTRGGGRRAGRGGRAVGRRHRDAAWRAPRLG